MQDKGGTVTVVSVISSTSLSTILSTYSIFSTSTGTCYKIGVMIYTRTCMKACMHVDTTLLRICTHSHVRRHQA